jgi:hypothetical protein
VVYADKGTIGVPEREDDIRLDAVKEAQEVKVWC